MHLLVNMTDIYTYCNKRVSKSRVGERGHRQSRGEMVLGNGRTWLAIRNLVRVTAPLTASDVEVAETVVAIVILLLLLLRRFDDCIEQGKLY